MKRMVAALLAALFLYAPTRAHALSTSATSAILVDAASGRILYEQNAHERRLIASITKLMTALVAAEAVADMDELVTVPHEATLAEGSSMYLRAGEEISMKALLYGLLLSSGNDAAVAVAIHCAGDVPTFAGWMNERAQSLGMKNSHFVNPNGLNHDEHYSTAYDMALLAAACMENETVAAIVGTKSITIGGHSLTNHNKLLWQYDGCVGMKTGYTELAGRTLVSCAVRNGQRLIAVTLNDRDDWADHAAMLDYGFANYPRAVLAEAGATFARVPVTGSLVRFVGVKVHKTLDYPFSEGEEAREVVELPNTLAAPIEAGAIVGRVSYYLGEKLLGESYLMTDAAAHSEVYQSRGLLGRIRDFLHGNPPQDMPTLYQVLQYQKGVA